MLRPNLHDATAALAEAEELRVRARRSNDDRALAMAIKRQAAQAGVIFAKAGMVDEVRAALRQAEAR